MFNQKMLDLAIVQTRDIFNTYIYKSDTDSISDIQVLGYFSESRFADSDPDGWFNGKIEIEAVDGYFEGFLNESGTVSIILNGGAYGVVYRNSTLSSITSITSTAIYFNCTLSPNPTTLEPASTSHFTSTGDGDLIYIGPSARFRWEWEGQGFVPGNTQEAIRISPMINSVAYEDVSARNQGDPFYSPWQSVGIIPLENGDVVRMGIRNLTNGDDVGILGFFLELEQISN